MSKTTTRAEAAKKAAKTRAENARKSKRKAAISAEEARLRQVYNKIPLDLMIIADGLIRRAAFMRVTLEDFENDIGENGAVELFSQTDKAAPYERERPVARQYNSLNSNYQKIIKQLTDLLPKPEEGGGAGKGDDGFEDFVNGRAT